MNRKQTIIQQPHRLIRDRKSSGYSGHRRPFWLPASSFYVLSFAVAFAIFILIWATLHDEGEVTPWIVAGIGSSIVLVTAVFLREVIFRSARTRYLRAERQLDYHWDSFEKGANINSDAKKISLSKNNFLIEQVRKKSEAARILEHVPDGHWEVFELCNEYLLLNAGQLQSVRIGSPRLAALRRGKEIVEKLQKFHLLNWVEIETHLLTEEANKQVELADKIELSQRAVIAIDSALEFYPDEKKLQDSKIALNEFISSIRVSYWIEQAERESFKKNYRESISLYRDALFYLARENVHHFEKTLIAERVNSEIEKIRNLMHENPHSGRFSQNIRKLVDNEND